MKINRDNYEVIFIDYLDGKLSDAQIHEFEAFLIQNPDLREELEGIEKFIIPEEELKFNKKENLKQIDLSEPINADNFDFYCIAEAEGDLSEQQRKNLNDFLIQNPEKKKDRDLIYSLKLKPDQKLIYNGKAGLRKSIFIAYRPAVYRSLAIAASIAILLVVYFSFLKNDLEQNFIAEEKATTEKTDTTGFSGSENAVPRNDIQEQSREKTPLIPINKEKIKKAATTISFKVGIPIAAVESEKTEEENINREEVLISKTNYNVLNSLLPGYISEVPRDNINSSLIITSPVKKQSNPDEYLSLDKVVLQKFTDLVFKEKEMELSGWGLASAGIEKISNATGAKMKLEAMKDEKGAPKRVNFNSRILSFSAPINRE